MRVTAPGMDVVPIGLVARWRRLPVRAALAPRRVVHVCHPPAVPSAGSPV